MALPENVTYFAPTATVDGDDTVYRRNCTCFPTGNTVSVLQKANLT